MPNRIQRCRRDSSGFQLARTSNHSNRFATFTNILNSSGPVKDGLVWGTVDGLTAASITFSRLRADSEVAQRYVLAAEEISVVRERLPHATEKTFPDCVREAEAAISREHKMWTAKRS